MRDPYLSEIHETIRPVLDAIRPLLSPRVMNDIHQRLVELWLHDAIMTWSTQDVQTVGEELCNVILSEDEAIQILDKFDQTFSSDIAATDQLVRLIVDSRTVQESG